MKIFKRILSITIIIALLAGLCVMSTISSSASGTGAGLSEWCLNAYYSGWSYVYGGSSPGAVDCSGLIYSYAGGHRTGDAQLYNSSYTGNVSSGVPRIHGLGLWQPGHVGVYVGDGMAVDARGSQYGVCYESVYTHGWTKYFKVPGVSYPTNGWVKVNGSKYYYENGQYIVNTTRTIDGVTYSFNSNGKCTSSSGAAESAPSVTPTLSTTLKLGSQGERVVKLQTRLQELGYYSGVIDGDFGKGTEEAFKLFQKQAGLYVDGLAGSDVDILYSDDAPYYESDDEDEDEDGFTVNNNKTDSELASTGVNDEDEDLAPTSFSKGDYHEEILKIQERLIELSYYEGYADGTYGTITEEAIKNFQGAHGITQTGVADEFTIEMLYSESASANPIEDDPTEAPSVVESELPISAQIANTQKNDTKPTEAPATEVVLETNKLSEKALAGIANTMSFEADASGNNFQFIFWLAVMIIVMTITFAVISAVEKKKSGKRTSREFF
ncbi:MAG: peptidoglycan-binding protein [Ruminococcus sp.]|nr:peptidoglycan-binding protein [Ruminococcus sp.]